MDLQTASVVYFYRDESKASKDVEEELKRRNISYREVWEVDAERQIPTLEVGNSLFEGFASIKFYLLRPVAHQNGVTKPAR